MVRIIDGNLFSTKAGIIAHAVNHQGVMGSGVAKQIKERFPKVYQSYHEHYKNFEIGRCQIIEVNDNLSVANLFTQEKYGYDGELYTSYGAVKSCLEDLYSYAKLKKRTVAIPYKMCCCRGGAAWEIIYQMILDIFIDVDVEIWRLDNG